MADFQQRPHGAGQGYPSRPENKGFGQNNAPPPQQPGSARDSGYASYANGSGAPYDPHYFPPPPKPDAHYGYPEDQADFQHNNASSDQQQPPSWQGSQQAASRSWGPSEANVDEGAALTPYDEEKAYAQYTEAYGQPDYSQYGQQYDQQHGHQNFSARSRPPPSTVSVSRYGTSQDDRGRRRRSSFQYDRDPRYDDRVTDRDRRRSMNRQRRSATTDSEDYDCRRREHRQRAREDDNHYYDYHPRERRRTSQSKPRGGGKDILRGGDGDRGLGASLLGGAAGAFLGDQADRGALGTIGGAVLGAIAAGGIDRIKSRKDQERQLRDRRRCEKEYAGTGGQVPYYSARASTLSPAAAPRDEFRPSRQLRGRPEEGRRRRRHEQGSSDSYASED